MLGFPGTIVYKKNKTLGDVCHNVNTELLSLKTLKAEFC